jgi:hypothetical protein
VTLVKSSLTVIRYLIPARIPARTEASYAPTLYIQTSRPARNRRPTRPESWLARRTKAEDHELSLPEKAGYSGLLPLS